MSQGADSNAGLTLGRGRRGGLVGNLVDASSISGQAIPVTNERKPPTSVSETIRQTKPFASARQEALLALLLTTDRVRGRLAKRLAELGDVTPQQYNVLRILRGAGPDGLPTLDVAERMLERTPGITRLVDRLERKQLVERHRSTRPGADRRQVWCRITGAGLELLESMDAPVQAADEAAAGDLSDDELRTLITLLNRLRAVAEEG